MTLNIPTENKPIALAPEQLKSIFNNYVKRVESTISKTVNETVFDDSIIKNETSVVVPENPVENVIVAPQNEPISVVENVVPISDYQEKPIAEDKISSQKYEEMKNAIKDVYVSIAKMDTVLEKILGNEYMKDIAKQEELQSTPEEPKQENISEEIPIQPEMVNVFENNSVEEKTTNDIYSFNPNPILTENIFDQPIGMSK